MHYSLNTEENPKSSYSLLGSFTFVLHTHLPYVLHHGKWPHGSDWLTEAASECYIPILNILNELYEEGVSPKLSMDFSPILLEQLSDPDFPEIFEEYCQEKIDAAKKDADYFRDQNEEHMLPNAKFWFNYYSRILREFRGKYNSDIVGAFRELQEKDILDPMTCGISHGYFPLLFDDRNIAAQLRGAVDVHTKHFGKPPAGVWLPECGYRPAYRWSPTIGPKEFRSLSAERKGVEELVARAGLNYFIVDGSLTKGGLPIPAYGPFSEVIHEKLLLEGFSPLPRIPMNQDLSIDEIYRVRSADDQATELTSLFFSRDAETSARVWSADMGYPGSPPYLDFHKKHHNSGLRYWAVTGAKVELDKKEQYHHAMVRQQIRHDAQDFVRLVSERLAEHVEHYGTPGIVASPFDTELFGHWWFEGPLFLKEVLRIVSESRVIESTNCRSYIEERQRPIRTVSIPEGSWGDGGGHFVWMNNDVRWMWDSIYPLEQRFLKILDKAGHSVSGEPERILKQAARELLLLEASDWEFVITTKGAIDYSKMRFGEHVERCQKFLTLTEDLLREDRALSDTESKEISHAEEVDRPFANLDLAWWRTIG